MKKATECTAEQWKELKKNRKKTKYTAEQWEELKKNRISIRVPEFLRAADWSRSKWYRHRSKIKRLNGYGREMIPIDEARRVLGEEVGEAN